MDTTTTTYPGVDDLVAALRTLRCEGPATAADVLDATDLRWPRDLREQVLKRMADEPA